MLVVPLDKHRCSKTKVKLRQPGFLSLNLFILELLGNGTGKEVASGTRDPKFNSHNQPNSLCKCALHRKEKRKQTQLFRSSKYRTTIFSGDGIKIEKRKACSSFWTTCSKRREKRKERQSVDLTNWTRNCEKRRVFQRENSRWRIHLSETLDIWRESNPGPQSPYVTAKPLSHHHWL